MPGPRLLLLSHHFPPVASAGALRWQKLAAYAAEWGWGLDVVMVDPDVLATRDDARLAELPPGTRLYGVAPPRIVAERLEAGLARLIRSLAGPVRALVRPAGLRRGASEAASGAGGPLPGRSPEGRPDSVPPEAIGFPRSPRDLLRAYWAWLDFARSAAWARRVEGVGRALLRPGVHQAIVSCGPPHMAHDAGRRLARRTGLPFVMDLRDPWAIRRRMLESVASPVWFRLARAHERRAVRQAGLVITNTEPVAEAMVRRYPGAARRILTVTNGYDDDPLPPARLGERFVVTYAGGIYLDRDPRPLFRAVAGLVPELGLTPEHFGIELVGRVEDYDGVPTGELVRAAGLEGFVRLRDPVPRRELLEILAGSAVLVSLPQDSPWAIPSKVFEYMQFDSWLLIFAEPGTPTERLLRGSAADVIAPGDERAIATVLRRHYQQFRAGERPIRVGSEPRFSRRYQAELLFSALARLIRGEPVGPSSGATAGPPAGRAADRAVGAARAVAGQGLEAHASE